MLSVPMNNHNNSRGRKNGPDSRFDCSPRRLRLGNGSRAERRAVSALWCRRNPTRECSCTRARNRLVRLTFTRRRRFQRNRLPTFPRTRAFGNGWPTIGANRTEFPIPWARATLGPSSSLCLAPPASSMERLSPATAYGARPRTQPLGIGLEAKGDDPSNSPLLAACGLPGRGARSSKGESEGIRAIVRWIFNLRLIVFNGLWMVAAYSAENPLQAFLA